MLQEISNDVLGLNLALVCALNIPNSYTNATPKVGVHLRYWKQLENKQKMKDSRFMK
jgi:hypothetical protein